MSARLLLLLLLTASGAAAGIACNGGGDSSAYLVGTVHDPGGAPLQGATVSVGGVSVQTQGGTNPGVFSINVVSGQQSLTASHSGYQTLHSQVLIMPGKNQMDLMLEPLVAPTPTPPYNISARFNGVPSNANTNPLPAWLGSAALVDAGHRVFGMRSLSGQCAYAECDNGSNPLNNGDPPSKITSCIMGWAAQGGGTTACGQDAVVQLVVQNGAAWHDGAEIVIQDPSVHPTTPAFLSYAEGALNTQNCGFTLGVVIGGTCSLNATTGYISLAKSGFVSGGFSYSAAVVASNGYFYVPNLP